MIGLQHHAFGHERVDRQTLVTDVEQDLARGVADDQGRPTNMTLRSNTIGRIFLALFSDLAACRLGPADACCRR